MHYSEVAASPNLSPIPLPVGQSGGTAMVDMSAIAAMMSALKGASDITQAMIGLRDAQALQTKVIELNTRILAAQSSAFAAGDERSTLIERIGTLEEEVASLKAWEAEKQRYELQRLPPGVFVYALKNGMERGEPPHRLCATCYQRDKKRILQEDDGYAECHECGSKLHWPTGRGSYTADYDPPQF
jgi:hypothetical protein